MSTSNDLPKISFKTTLKYLRQDHKRFLGIVKKTPSPRNALICWFTPTMHVAILYRLSHWSQSQGLSLLSRFFWYLNILFFGAEITPVSVIGPGFCVMHPVGLIVHGKVGKNSTFLGRNGIGPGTGPERHIGSEEGWFGGPIIGDGLTMAPGAGILTSKNIGNDVYIAPQALVTKSVKDGALMMGIPAKPSKLRFPLS